MLYHVYMLASQRNGTIYIGVTNDLGRRVYEHKTKRHIGFTSTYGVDKLVWSETYDQIDDALSREKKLKKWRRAWKLALIEDANPRWVDLYDTLRLSSRGSP